MSLASELPKGPDGNLSMYPVFGWITGTAAGTAVLLCLEYVGSEEDLRTATKRKIQFGLMPAQALELAETLTRLANKCLSPGGETQH